MLELFLYKCVSVSDECSSESCYCFKSLPRSSVFYSENSSSLYVHHLPGCVLFHLDVMPLETWHRETTNRQHSKTARAIAPRVGVKYIAIVFNYN